MAEIMSSKTRGIIHESTAPYTPQHNGVSERTNRMLMNPVRVFANQEWIPKVNVG
jgi:hypothetical protein